MLSHATTLLLKERDDKELCDKLGSHDLPWEQWGATSDDFVWLHFPDRHCEELHAAPEERF